MNCYQPATPIKLSSQVTYKPSYLAHTRRPNSLSHVLCRPLPMIVMMTMMPNRLYSPYRISREQTQVCRRRQRFLNAPPPQVVKVLPPKPQTPIKHAKRLALRAAMVTWPNSCRIVSCGPNRTTDGTRLSARGCRLQRATFSSS